MLKMRERTNGTADDLPVLDRALPSLVNHASFLLFASSSIDLYLF
jgi:hypothetical protein